MVDYRISEEVIPPAIGDVGFLGLGCLQDALDPMVSVIDALRAGDASCRATGPPGCKG